MVESQCWLFCIIGRQIEITILEIMYIYYTSSLFLIVGRPHIWKVARVWWGLPVLTIKSPTPCCWRNPGPHTKQRSSVLDDQSSLSLSWSIEVAILFWGSLWGNSHIVSKVTHFLCQMSPCIRALSSHCWLADNRGGQHRGMNRGCEYLKSSYQESNFWNVFMI